MRQRQLSSLDIFLESARGQLSLMMKGDGDRDTAPPSGENAADNDTHNS